MGEFSSYGKSETFCNMTFHSLKSSSFAKRIRRSKRSFLASMSPTSSYSTWFWKSLTALVDGSTMCSSRSPRVSTLRMTWSSAHLRSSLVICLPCLPLLVGALMTPSISCSAILKRRKDTESILIIWGKLWPGLWRALGSMMMHSAHSSTSCPAVQTPKVFARLNLWEQLTATNVLAPYSTQWETEVVQVARNI